MDDNTVEIPEKLFYKAAEVCQITDTQPYVLRFWESEFPQLASEKNRSGQRVYRRQDIDLVFRIKRLLYQEEYTIAGARKAIDDERETIVDPVPAKARGRRTTPPPAADQPSSHAEPAAAMPTSLFGESHLEVPAPDPKPNPAAEEEARYRALHEESLAALNDLRERNRRLAARLESALS